MDAQAMTKIHLAEHPLMLAVLSGSAWFAVGVLLGTFHFMALRWNVRMLAAGQSVLLPLAIQLVRFALVVSVLAMVVVHFGALPLLAAAAGILAARAIVLRIGMPS
jgi:F1F0 ATPase subunit 2